MPARSKSQQRLFGMVHAYNKGEFHGSRSLRNRVAALSRRISDEDARHFAETPHAGLPERKEKRADDLSPAIFSRDVLAGSVPTVLRDADNTLQVLGPMGNMPSDAMIVAEKEVSPLLAAWYARRRARMPRNLDLGRMYDLVREDARLFRRLKALGLVGLPHHGKERRIEKQAQIMFRPDEINALYGRLAPRLEDAVERASARSKRRRSFLGHVVSGTAKGALWGTALGGLGAGALGVGLANGAADSASLPQDVLRDKLVEAGVRCGLFGAGRGALVGSLAGLGVGTLNAIRE